MKSREEICYKEAYKAYIISDKIDKFHGTAHLYGVLDNINSIVDNINIERSPHMGERRFRELCFIAGCWHDTGRSYDHCRTNDIHHESASASDFTEFAYNKDLFSRQEIRLIADAIARHNWRDKENTVIGRVLQDADKLDFYNLDRLKLGTDSQVNEVFNLYDVILKHTLNYEYSRQIFTEKYFEAKKQFGR